MEKTSERDVSRVWTGTGPEMISVEEARSIEEYLEGISESPKLNIQDLERIADALKKYPLAAIRLYKEKFIGRLLCSKNVKRSWNDAKANVLNRIIFGISQYFDYISPQSDPYKLRANDKVVEIIFGSFGDPSYLNPGHVEVFEKLAASNPGFFLDRHEAFSKYIQKSLFSEEADKIFRGFIDLIKGFKTRGLEYMFVNHMKDAVSYLVSRDIIEVPFIGRLKFLTEIVSRYEGELVLDYLQLEKLLCSLGLFFLLPPIEEGFREKLAISELLCCLALSPSASVRLRTNRILRGLSNFVGIVQQWLAANTKNFIMVPLTCLLIQLGRISASCLLPEDAARAISFVMEVDENSLLSSRCPGMVYKFYERLDYFSHLSKAFLRILAILSANEISTVTLISKTRVMDGYVNHINIFSDACLKTQSDVIRGRMESLRTNAVLHYADFLEFAFLNMLTSNERNALSNCVRGASKNLVKLNLLIKVISDSFMEEKNYIFNARHVVDTDGVAEVQHHEGITQGISSPQLPGAMSSVRYHFADDVIIPSQSE